MTRDTPAISRFVAPTTGWSNRVLLLALAGILFLTFYPFQFAPRATSLAHSSPFLLGGIAKGGRALEVYLNILLFMPFGFGVSEKLRERGWGWRATALATWIAGILLSYGVEFLQQYTPTRASRWEDVCTNSAGAIAGFILFALCGRFIVEWSSRAESALRASLTPRRALLLIPIYFVLWFGLSMCLQRETRLTNWDAESRLLVGNGAGQWQSPNWKGSVSRLQFWNRALPDDLARSLTAGGMPAGSQSGLLASYDFLAPAPAQDQTKFLPALSWSPGPPPTSTQSALVFDRGSWLSSQVPVSNLVEALEKTNQFSLEFAFTPAESAGVDGGIISISPAPRRVDLFVRQQDSNLVFWFRSAVTASQDGIIWSIPNTFVAGQRRDVLLTYDGSDVSVYLDGKARPNVFELGPGTVLAESIRHVKATEFRGYSYIYDALIFLPAGALFGMVAIPVRSRVSAVTIVLAIEFVLPPWLLDRILSHVSGRPISVGTIFLSLVLVAAGSLWINADRRRPASGT